jgi:hypothetical protein
MTSLQQDQFAAFADDVLLRNGPGIYADPIFGGIRRSGRTTAVAKYLQKLSDTTLEVRAIFYKAQAQTAIDIVAGRGSEGKHVAQPDVFEIIRMKQIVVICSTRGVPHNTSRIDLAIIDAACDEIGSFLCPVIVM